MKSELVPVNGDPPIPITKDLTVIGRREFCDVQIPHGSLSKRHCVLVRTDGLLMVRDLASTNGTKVNGQKVMWAALLPNDRLTLGRYKLRVYLGSDEAPSPSEGGKLPETAAASWREESPSEGLAIASANGAAPRAAEPPADVVEDDLILDGNALLIDEDDEDLPLIDLD